MTDWRLAEQVLSLCREVGSAQKAAFRRDPPGGGIRKCPQEWYSAVDVESEERLREGLQRILPEAGFFGEETGHRGSDSILWIVDPLDGTTNFLSGLEPFAISVALTHEGQPILGVIYNPSNEEAFVAVRGLGAIHNAQPIQLASSMTLSQAVVSIGLPPALSRITRDAHLDCLGELWSAVRDLRCIGSAALEISYVAAGFLQGFWETWLRPWDVAAALVVVGEAGCHTAGLQGEPYSLFKSTGIVVGIPGVFEALREIILKHELAYERDNEPDPVEPIPGYRSGLTRSYR